MDRSDHGLVTAALLWACMAGCADRTPPPGEAAASAGAEVDTQTAKLLKAQEDLLDTQREMIAKTQSTLELEAERRAELEREVVALRIRLEHVEAELKKKADMLQGLKDHGVPVEEILLPAAGSAEPRRARDKRD